MPQMTFRRENGQFWEASWKDPGEGWSVVCTDKGVQLERNGCIYPPEFVPPPLEISQSEIEEIRRAQWRVRQRKAIESGKHPEADWRKNGRFKRRDYQTWLLRQPHGFLDLSREEIFEFFPFLQTRVLSDNSASLGLPLPYQRIGDLLFPEVKDPANRKKRAADAYNRVESEFGWEFGGESRRGTLKREPKLDLSGPGHYW
jgi:hypothetical protein